MPRTKDPIARLAIIDRFLCGKEALTLTEITNGVNEELIAQHQSPVVKSTIVKDLNFIIRSLGIDIDKKPKGKEFTYRYKNPSVSIFNSTLTLVDIEKLNLIVELIKDFIGLPQFEWLSQVSDRLHLSTLDDSKKKPIVRFMHNPTFSEYRLHFNPLYEIIQEKKAIELTYRKFNSSEAKTYVVHPYELKEFACRWYLVGSVDHHPGSISCFGFERIISYKVSDVPYRENTRDLDEYFNSMLGLTLNDDDEPKEVLLWVENREYPYLESNPIHESQKIVREVDDGKVISLHLCVNYELEMRLLAYGERVVVLSPEDLNQRLSDRFEASIINYRKKRNLLNEKITEN
jgi:predicted DNA-binding transcriptional regulator YafY